MDLALVLVAFAFGFGATTIRLLFGIGLKLRVNTLARPVVWAGASIHAAMTTALIGSILLAMGALGLPLASGLSPAEAALAGFAFSFSSTVFAVKALEDATKQPHYRERSPSASWSYKKSSRSCS